MIRICCAAALFVLLLWLPAASGQSRSAAEPAFQQFFAARSTAEAARATDAIARSGVAFDDALRRLKQGRVYTPQKTGAIMMTNRTEDKVEHYFAVNVPATYDPSRQYQVRFQLHGGVMARSNNQPRNSGEIGTLAGAEQFYVIPYGWTEAPWWSEDQILNLRAIVDTLKRTYNIDENRVVVAGVSDGGTGAFYIAMRETTPFASFLPLNAFIMVLANSDTGVREDLYPNNLRNKPLFVVNGGRDRLYPISSVEPYTKHLMKTGVTIDYHPQPLGEHNTAWWPEIKDPFERFVAAHPRDPSPGQLTWETSDLVHNRAHWLVIDKLAAQPGDPSQARGMVEVNDFSPIDVMAIPMFERRRRSGRVDLVRTGNAVAATTRGVAAFTLLLSPDAFDFNKPIKITVNGRTVHDARVQPSVATLLKWAARDNDRTMLYGAELPISVAR